LADLSSFWTDSREKFPTTKNAAVWLELWLTNNNNTDAFTQAKILSERTGIQIRPTFLRFHNVIVVLVFASLKQLEEAIELISCLEEIRAAKETPHVVTQMRPIEQNEWVNDIRRRSVISDNSSVSIAILDTGVNYNHPLLSLACNQQWAVSWNDQWAKYTDNPLQQQHYHGSLQAGLALFGDLMNVVGTSSPISIPYRLESGRILSPTSNNPPELYGAITTQTACLVHDTSPDRSRVYSLAVTAAPESMGGLPSSWSAEVDAFTYGLKEYGPQLMVVATGNNRELNPRDTHWDQAVLAEIEDPAQAWNVITVGGYTELTSNDDPYFAGWEPWCYPGEMAPASRTSINWQWRNQAPYKPDIVAEAGNRLISPLGNEIADADCVSILTTSGRTTGVLFDTTRDTSAATALVSRYAGILMCEYPDYWPETIRALLIHSAQWTSAMLDRKANLEQSQSRTNAVKTMLRAYGFGVPDLEKAKFSADHLLTLVSQRKIKPFTKGSGSDAKLNEMHYYALPWPEDALNSLAPETLVKLKVTLSYFVEPNPGSPTAHREAETAKAHRG